MTNLRSTVQKSFFHKTGGHSYTQPHQPQTLISVRQQQQQQLPTTTKQRRVEDYHDIQEESSLWERGGDSTLFGGAGGVSVSEGGTATMGNKLPLSLFGGSKTMKGLEYGGGENFIAIQPRTIYLQPNQKKALKSKNIKAVSSSRVDNHQQKNQH